MQQVPRSFVIKTGILNPSIQSLLCRVRHTNLLVIADRGFPFWADIETIDISLVDDVPQVTQVMEAVLQNFQVGRAWMASEFIAGNSARQVASTRALLGSVPLEFVSHLDLKQKVPQAIGLIRTGDTTQYANIILESA